MHDIKILVKNYVDENIDIYFNKLIYLLDDVSFAELIDAINPYLFCMNRSKTAGTIIIELLDRFLAVREENMFGDWLEDLAIYINQKIFSGWKSRIKGIDLEFDKNDVRYIVSIKSSPNWGNSSQIEKMETNFNIAKKTLRTSNSKLQIVCINGCCFGKDGNSDKGSYYKYCGQKFWDFIGGNENFYTDIIEPLGHKAKERNEDYLDKYSQMVNRFTKEFIELFCDNHGKIDWKKLVEFNSGRK
jgi:hypothetical protein